MFVGKRGGAEYQTLSYVAGFRYTVDLLGY